MQNDIDEIRESALNKKQKQCYITNKQRIIDEITERNKLAKDLYNSSEKSLFKIFHQLVLRIEF
jgi:hypothetical protein